MTKNLLIATAILATLLLNSACTVNADSVAPETPAVQDTFASEIEGPDLQGTWISACNEDYNYYRQVKVVLTAKGIERSNNVYTDSKCTVINQKDESHGLYRWLGKTTYGGYLAEYKMDIGNGWSQFLKEEILLESGKLYLSNYSVGFDSIRKENPMYRDGVIPKQTRPIIVEDVE